MPLLVRQIFERKLFEGARLVAGFSGLDNPISWVNLMEILDAVDSLQKGEFLITTGYQLDDETRYADVVSRLRRRDVSAMAVQTGYYLQEIPEYIVRSANAEGFPVIELPPNLTFSAMIHTLMEQLALQPAPRTDNSLDTLFKMLAELTEWNPSLFSGEGGADSYLFLATGCEDDVRAGETAQDGILRIRSYLLSQAREFEQVSLPDGRTAFCLNLQPENTFEDVIFELTILLTFLSEQQHINYHIGVDRITDAGNLRAAFEHTVACCNVLERIGAKRGVCPHQNIPFFELFDAIHRNNRSVLLGSGALQKLLDYDRTNRSAYVHTLRVYLAHQGNVVQSAARLFIHRHTMINRLQKITELCSLNLNDYYTRIYLSLALMLHDYFAL